MLSVIMLSDVMVSLAKNIDNYNSESDFSQTAAFFYFIMARKREGDIPCCDTQHKDTHYKINKKCSADGHIKAIMLCVIMLRISMLCVIMVCVIMLSAFIMSVSMKSVYVKSAKMMRVYAIYMLNTVMTRVLMLSIFILNANMLSVVNAWCHVLIVMLSVGILIL
jgi:hypothetical protein